MANSDKTPSSATSRRQFMRAGAAIAAVTTAAPATASAQSDADLPRLQGARRILLKGKAPPRR